MADVFLAVARGPMGFNKLTVIKRLRSDHLGDPSFLNMLLDEARLAARLSHPNVVHTYEVGEHRGAYFIAMEYLEGQPLNKIIKATGKGGDVLEPAYCARIISDALSGLHHAHELRDYDGSPLQIIHRDVSPHNIFVTYDGQVKLMDFGIAKAASSSTKTEVGVLKGKIAYMAPEQASGGAVDRRADVFAMGIVLWELLTRQRLFSSTSAAATLHKLMSTDARRVSSVLPSIDPSLDEIVAKALARDPAARYQTAAEMRDALEAFIAVVTVQKRIRQEEIGVRVSEMFEDTRQNVHRQIQQHMGEVNVATNTSELMALDLESLKRFEGTPSGRGLLDLGSLESGSGSGVVSAAGGDGSRPTTSRKTAPKKNGTRRAAIALAVAVAACVVLLGMRCGKQTESGAAAIATPSDVTTPTIASSVSAALPRGGAIGTASSVTDPRTAAPTASATASASPASSAQAARPDPAAVTGPKASLRAAHDSPRAQAHAAAAANPTPAATVIAPPAETAAAAPDEGIGYVTLDTYPWTRVSEGGRLLGVTPLVHQALPAGSHTLTLENTEQGIKQSYPVTVKAGETVSRRLGLQ